LLNDNDSNVCFRTLNMSSSMKRTASDIDADEAKLPSKRLKTEAGPVPVSSESVGIKRKDDSDSAPREVEGTGKPFPKLDLAYPPKISSSEKGGRPVLFQQPTALTTFSYDSKRELRFDDTAMRYYVDPPQGADLRYGYERWVKRPEEKGRLDGLLKAWLKVRNGFPDGIMNDGVIAWRGVMTRYVNGP
jgi:RAT1-interacting protein